jgi:hypothetical protein
MEMLSGGNSVQNWWNQLSPVYITVPHTTLDLTMEIQPGSSTILFDKFTFNGFNMRPLQRRSWISVNIFSNLGAEKL